MEKFLKKENIKFREILITSKPIKKKISSKKDFSVLINQIQDFCKEITKNSDKSIDLFLNLPYSIQRIFAHHAYQIIMLEDGEYSHNTRKVSLNIIKILTNPKLSNQKIYEYYEDLTMGLGENIVEEKLFSLGREKQVKKRSRSKKPRNVKKYDKEGQRYEGPKNELDPKYLFYNSLYTQNPKSQLAITWLTERGVFDGKKRQELVKKYKVLKEKGELIK